jgi:hypothetical protein
MTMLRRIAQGRTSFAAVGIGHEIEEVDVRRGGARLVASLGRILLAPLAALAAALAGAVFLVLLPICGIATIAEGVARSCWDSASMPALRRRAASGRTDD